MESENTIKTLKASNDFRREEDVEKSSTRTSVRTESHNSAVRSRRSMMKDKSVKKELGTTMESLGKVKTESN